VTKPRRQELEIDSLSQREDALRTGWRALYREQDRVRRQAAPQVLIADLEAGWEAIGQRARALRRRESTWARFDRDRDTIKARARYLQRRGKALDAQEREIERRQSWIDEDATIIESLSGAHRYQLPAAGWAVYRIVAEDSHVLYVGLSRDVRKRLAGHTGAAWFPHMRALHVEYFGTEGAARWRERELIRHLAPPGNTMGVPRSATAEARP